MAHNFDTGFTVRTPAWHGLGITLAEHPDNWDEARRAAGLLWEPAEDVIYRTVRLDGPTARTIDGAIATADPELWMVPLREHKLIKRDDTGAELSVQRTDYRVINHGTMGQLLDEVAKEAGTAFKFETAGSLQGGRKVWALARLDEPFTVPGDDSATYPYFALQNAHDGEGACRIIPTQVRIVCQNTWQLASDKATFEVVIRHAGNVDDRIEQAKGTLAQARQAAASYRTTMTELAELRYDDAVLATFLEHFIPTPEGALATPRRMEMRAEHRNLCRRLLADSPTLAPLPDTAYKLVQVAGEYLDHARQLPVEDEAKRRDVYLKRTLLGGGDSNAHKAGVVSLARELCTVGV
jgi:phage/plasmid-like protein (TIGR03299 family)